MDLTPLLTAPILIMAAAIVAVSVWIGYALGKSNENKRKEIALNTARQEAGQSNNRLQHSFEEKMEVLQKAHASDLQKEKDSHATQVERMHKAHQSVVDSLKSSHADETENLRSEHVALIGKLEASSSENMNKLKAESEQRIGELKKEMADALSNLRQDHEQTIKALRQQAEQTLSQVKEENERRIQELKDRHTAEVTRLNAQISEQRQERETLHRKTGELETTIIELQNEIREARLNNMFSVSKSGEKLIRVVRSVQELANELDETSRTVTDGEYSFFEQIKDQRDRDVVLSLTGGNTGEAVVEESDETEGDSGASATEKAPGI